MKGRAWTGKTLEGQGTSGKGVHNDRNGRTNKDMHRISTGTADQQHMGGKDRTRTRPNKDRTRQYKER
jgi:hypothetical protein